MSRSNDSAGGSGTSDVQSPEFVEHYHLERNHQGIDNRLIMGTPAADAARPVRRRPRLGGLLSYYERARDQRVGRDVEQYRPHARRELRISRL